MVYEYALEPELVATWTDRRDFRYFIERFGLGQGRVVSRYPKRWAALVWEAFGGTGDLDRKRLEELLAHFKERMVRRTDIRWEPDLAWLANAEREHERRPFHAILARTNPRRSEYVLIGEEVDELSTPLWSVDRAPPAREAYEMANALAPLLRCSSVVIFVDPYIGQGRSDHRRTIEAFLDRTMRGRPGPRPDRVEIHTAAETCGSDDFIRARFRGCVPDGLHVVVRRLEQRQSGEKLHNRYVLTDLGGVLFGIGLDQGAAGETEDITLLNRIQYELRWAQYAAGDSPAAFEQPERTVEVIGTRRLLG